MTKRLRRLFSLVVFCSLFLRFDERDAPHLAGTTGPDQRIDFVHAIDLPTGRQVSMAQVWLRQTVGFAEFGDWVTGVGLTPAETMRSIM
jgi:hypothetical protein